MVILFYIINVRLLKYLRTQTGNGTAHFPFLQEVYTFPTRVYPARHLNFAIPDLCISRIRPFFSRAQPCLRCGKLHDNVEKLDSNIFACTKKKKYSK